MQIINLAAQHANLNNRKHSIAWTATKGLIFYAQCHDKKNAVLTIDFVSMDFVSVQVFVHVPLLRAYFLGGGHMHKLCPHLTPPDRPGKCLSCELVSTSPCKHCV